MEIDLTGKHALVCGSTQGIGKAIANSLASSRGKITLMARDPKGLAEVTKELPGSGHQFIVADFADAETVSAAIDKLAESQVDILINNTGGPSPGQVQNATWDAFDRALNMHLRASHSLVQGVLPKMKSNGYGRIINVISTSTKMPIPGLGVSNTVRGAMASWSKTLSMEVALFGITVNNILPGPIETERLATIIRDKAVQSGETFEQVAEQMKKSVPTGRFGHPAEIGALATFLCSDFAAYINGVSIPVDGGRTGSL